MRNRSGRTGQRTNNLRDELIWGQTLSVNWPTLYIHVGVSGAVTSLLRQVTNGWCIIAPVERYIAGIDIFNKKRKCCNHRCPDSVHFHTLFLIIYLSAIEILICHREMSLIGLLPSVLHKIRYMIFKIPY